jgi:hypothetical protein
VNGDVVELNEGDQGYPGPYDSAEEAEQDAGCQEVVGASTTFTISGACDAVDDVASFTISGNLGEGVTLQVAGQTVTASGAYSFDVGAAGSYPYVVTLDEGFVLAEGSPAAEDVIILEDCTPQISIQVLGVCDNDTPWLYYSVTVSGDLAPGSDTVDISWFGPDAVERTDPARDYDGLPLTGSLTGHTLKADGSIDQTITNANRVLWPGARVLGGEPVDWPGWTFQVDDESATSPVYDTTAGILAGGTMLDQNGATGVWDQTDDGFKWARQPGAFVTLEVNPTGTAQLAYPPSNPTCSAAPDEVSDTEVDADELPFTGVDVTTLAIVSTVLIGAGTTILLSQRRREET